MKNEKKKELFNDYVHGFSISGEQPSINSTGVGDDTQGQHEEAIAKSFASLFRITRVGGSIVFTGSNRTFEASIPNGTTFQLKRTK